MNASNNSPPWISEPLTWAEICKRYPDEWVCLVEMDRVRPHEFEFRTARVVGHGKTRTEPFEQAEPFWETHKLIGHYFTGRIRVHWPLPRVILDDEIRDIFFPDRR
jgi:hypothetical protein